LKTRVISGIGIGLILVASLVSGGYVLGAVLLFVSLIGFLELTRAITTNERGTSVLFTAAGIVATGMYYGFTLYSKSIDYFTVCAAALFLLLSSVYVIFYPKYKLLNVLGTMLAFIYCPVFLSMIYLVRIMPGGEFFVWLFFIAWVCDTSAYFVGTAFGKHKLTPELSPKKSVEGAIGGVVCSAIAGLIYAVVVYMFHSSDASYFYKLPVIALFASVFSQIGDLFASGIKREHGIKDFGNVIPGHGGIMDRFDSVIFICPVIYFLIKMLQ